MTCCKYTAGMLVETITIQAATTTTDEVGGFSETWATVSGSPTRANIVAAAGSEKWGYMRNVSGNTYKMITRAFDGAAASQRVLWNGGQYAVLGVVPADGGRAWLEWRLTDGKPS